MHSHFAAALLLAAALSTAPASAAVVLITQTKAVNGGVTTGDTPGFPVTLSQAGVYRFDTNLNVSADKVGIQVTAKNVTIDLNGFTLQGSNVAVHGIFGSASNLTIQNGTIEDFEFDGIVGPNAAAFYWRIEGMRIVSNGRDGIRCSTACYVRGNTIVDNTRNGITFSATGIALDNIIFENDGIGITAVGFVGYSQNAILENFTNVTNSNQMDPNICDFQPCP